MRSGDVVGSYRIRDSVGSGRTGAVYSAEKAGEIFILKILSPECSANPSAVSVFHQRAQQAGALVHPSIERIADCGHAPNGSAFTSRPFVPSLSLAEFIDKNGPLAPMTAVRLMHQVAEALHVAHKSGLSHLALSPNNTLVCLDTPELPRAVIIDFGIAAVRADAEKRGLPASAIEYRSPEQCLGGNRVDHRSDLYSLGCLLYTSVCGQPLFSGDEKEVRAAHIRTKPPLAAAMVPSTPSELSALISTLLQKSVDNRLPDAGAVVRALDEILQRLAPVPRPPALQPPPRHPAASVPPPAHAVIQASLGAPAIPAPRDSIDTQVRAPIPPSDAPPVRASAPMAPVQPSAAGPPPPTHSPGPMAEPVTPPDELKAARRGHTLGLSLLIVGALAAAAAALWIAQSGSLSAKKTASEAAAPPVTVPRTGDTAAAASPPAATSVPAAAAPTADEVPLRENGALDRPAGLVTLTIESEPAGATVTRKSDGVALGTTPYVYQVEPIAGVQEFSLELAGHKPASVSLPGNRDGVRQVLLLRDKNAVVGDTAAATDQPLPERGQTAARRAAEEARGPAPDPTERERARSTARRSTETASRPTRRKPRPKSTGKAAKSDSSGGDDKTGVVDYTAPPVPL